MRAGPVVGPQEVGATFGSLGFAVIRPHIWRQRVGQIANLSYSWADTTAIPNEPNFYPGPA